MIESFHTFFFFFVFRNIQWCLKSLKLASEIAPPSRLHLEVGYHRSKKMRNQGGSVQIDLFKLSLSDKIQSKHGAHTYSSLQGSHYHMLNYVNPTMALILCAPCTPLIFLDIFQCLSEKVY